MANAFSLNMKLQTFEQEADLAAAQYLAVKITGANIVNLAGAGEDAVGILQIPSASGEVGAGVAVAVEGTCKAIFGATVADGAKVTPDAAGKLITATGTAKVLGTAVLGGATDEVGSVIIEKSGQFASA